MHWAIAAVLVFVGCCSNLIFLEYLVREHPGSGTIITFSHFLFIAVEGFILTSKFGTVSPAIPIKEYVIMVLMFFVVQLGNNLSFACNISVPLHTIFRSGTLLTNLLLGMVLLNKTYNWKKYLSVILVTVGITVYTLASKKEATHHTNDDTTKHTEMGDYIQWLSGIALLLFALFMTARMGIFQEISFKKYGKHPREALFYNHALPLPCFLFVAKNIYEHAILFHQSEPMLLPVLNITIPKMWVYLAGNVITQYICIRGVFILSSECTSLTVTFILTLRKFFSLCVSILYFSNAFTTTHFVGSSFVFVGSMLFMDVVSILRQLLASTKEKTS